MISKSQTENYLMSMQTITTTITMCQLLDCQELCISPPISDHTNVLSSLFLTFAKFS